MINFTSKERYGMDDLAAIVTLLRGPGGCPWDGAQTHLSIRRNLLEEAYEACEGIDRDDPALMCEELGDVLLQVLFHADIEREAGRFTLDDVCDGICKKLIFRHPHVFSNERNIGWEELKQQEKGQSSVTQTLDSVARSLPSLWRAEKIQKKAAKGGFVWESLAASLDKLDEETAELRDACRAGSGAEEELGDVLFAAVSVAVQLGADPEEALHAACEKFIRRFGAMEQAAQENGTALSRLSREDLLALWSAQKETAVRKSANPSEI